MSHLRQKDKSAPSFSFTWRIVVNSHVLPRTIMFGLELLGSASKSNNRLCYKFLLTLTLLFSNSLVRPRTPSFGCVLELFSFGLELPRSARAAMFTFCTHTHTIRYYQFGVTVFGNRVIHALHTILTSRPGVLRAAQLLVLSSTRRCHGDNQGLT